jgi:hypothetical protein
MDSRRVARLALFLQPGTAPGDTAEVDEDWE